MRITVKVFPDARRERVTKKSETAFEIFVREDAVGNAANDRVREILATMYTVPVAQVRIIRGHHSPQKGIEIIV